MKALLKQVPLLVPMARLIRRNLDPMQRTYQRLSKTPASTLFQPSAFTSLNRYPKFFEFIHDQLTDIRAPELLSYGCATGEEVFSLHKHLPTARIKGLDINAHCIRECERKRARHRNAALRFECAGTPEREPDATYHAVFCLAVTRHGSLDANRPVSCDSLLMFNDFERLVTDLARCLRPNGYLIIWHSNFRFADTAVAAQFDVVLHHHSKRPELRAFYGPDNRLISGAPTYTEAIFRKRD